MVTRRELRAQALAVGRQSAKAGFSTEASIDWLMQRIYMAVLGFLARSEHQSAALVAKEIFGSGWFDAGVDWAALPEDQPMKPFMETVWSSGPDQFEYDLWEFFFASLPNADEGDGQIILAKFGIRSSLVLKGYGYRYTVWINRATLGGYDRWFWSYDGGCPTGMYYFEDDAVSAERTSRRNEAIDWTLSLNHFLEIPEEITVYGDAQMFEAIKRAVAKKWPKAKVWREITPEPVAGSDPGLRIVLPTIGAPVTFVN